MPEARPTESRLKYYQAAPEGRPMAARQAYLYGCVLEPPIIELVKLRAPQINGCAFGVDVHWKGAKALGESHEGAYQSRNAPASSN